jgi:hypothetical protein
MSDLDKSSGLPNSDSPGNAQDLHDAGLQAQAITPASHEEANDPSNSNRGGLGKLRRNLRGAGSKRHQSRSRSQPNCIATSASKLSEGSTGTAFGDEPASYRVGVDEWVTTYFPGAKTRKEWKSMETAASASIGLWMKEGKTAEEISIFDGTG